MTVTIQGPDGAQIDFPDETSEAEMNAAMAQAYPAPAQGGGVIGALKGASRALEANLPFVDRAVAAAKPGDYATNLATEQAKNAQFAQQNPVTNFVGGIAASAPLVPLAGPTFGLGGLGGRVASAALPWGIAGGVQGASNSPDLTNLPETAKDTALGAATGGTLGAAVPLAGAAVGKAISPLAAMLRGGPGAADVAKLGSDVKAAYQNVENLGASYSPDQVQAMTNKIASDAAEERLNPKLHPKASAVIEGLQNWNEGKPNQPMTLSDLDQMRQYVNDNLGGLPEPKQARFGQIIKGNIDDFIKSAEPQAMEAEAAPAAPNFNPAVGSNASYIPPGEAQVAAATPPVPKAPPLAPRPTGPAPQDLHSFINQGGKLKDEGGDLRAAGLDKLVDTENGRPMDEGRRAAAQAGYLGYNTDEAVANSTVPDFIDRIVDHPAYSIHDDEAVAAREAYKRSVAERERFKDENAPSQIEGLGQEQPAAAAVAPAIVPPAPSAADASAAIQNARDLAMRQFKAKALADALSKAEINADVAGTGGNIENATRRRLASILEKEPWSPDEVSQINRMIHGTPLTNTLRQFSRFGPRGNALMAAMELASGSPTAIRAAVGGTGAQAGEALARRAGQGKLLSTILAGGKAPAAPQIGPGPTRAALAAALAARQQLPPQRNTAQ